MYFVYLICAEIGDEKVYKVGYTRRSPEQRIKEFKTGNASDFYVVDSFKSKWGTKIESVLKKTYNKYNINGEWFILPDSEVADFNSRCFELHDTFEFLSNNNSYIIKNGWL